MNALFSTFGQVGIGAIIGFFLKYILDRRSKSFEIKHKLFQENRLSTVVKFYSGYAECVHVLVEYGIDGAYTKDKTIDDYNNAILVKLSTLMFSITTLNFYLDGNERSYVKEIMERVNFAEAYVRQLFDPGKTKDELLALDERIEIQLVQNDEIMRGFQEVVKATYNERQWL